MTADAGRFDRIDRFVARYAPGVHILRPPAPRRAIAALPAPLQPVYAWHDGGELFHGALTILPAADVVRDADRWRVADVGRDTIYVDARGAVWRLDGDIGDWIPDGTSFDRWLDGWLEGEAVLYDRDGEFRDFGVDEAGDLTPQAAVARERRAHARDRRAAGPWWRLCRALVRTGQTDAARAELERLVATHPRFAWAWLDLARISAAAGEFAGAADEAMAAAEAAPDGEHTAYFWACAARYARAAGDEPQRAACAARALALAPDLARAQRDGAAALARDGDRESAAELVAIALALAPRDLDALALSRALADDPP
ncbi:MAG: tetratricopeptide repeat protein [Deltaproteobacteria bacterium]|nr:MAG: tetratricopeptide repeat protein [Deltaproteobacteria bacterium]